MVVTYRAGEVYAERSYISCTGNQAGSARLQHLPPSLVLAPGKIGDMHCLGAIRCQVQATLWASQERGSGSGVVLVDQIDDEKTSRCLPVRNREKRGRGHFADAWGRKPDMQLRRGLPSSATRRAGQRGSSRSRGGARGVGDPGCLRSILQGVCWGPVVVYNKRWTLPPRLPHRSRRRSSPSCRRTRSS